MVRHRFNLRVKHGMKDKMLHPGGPGSRDRVMTNTDLIRADIRTDVKDSPGPLDGIFQNRWIAQIDNQDILDA